MIPRTSRLFIWFYGLILFAALLPAGLDLTRWSYRVYLAWAATTRYVDGTLGADCTAGNYSIANRACNGSDGNAYNTLNEGVSATAAGDTLYVRAGTYNESVFEFPVCTSLAPCLISGYQSETATVAPVTLGAQGDVFRLYLARYVTIEKLTISAASATTAALNNIIRLQLGSSFITLKDNQIIGRTGANARGNGISMHDSTNSGHVIVGNRIRNVGQPCSIDPDTCNQWHGVYVRGSGHTITRNHIHDVSGGHGVHFQDSGSNTNRNVVEFNLIQRTGSSGILIGSGDDHIARWNIVEEAALEISGAAGLRCRHYGATRCVMYGNTIVNTGGASSPINANYGLSLYDGSGHVARNNIVCGAGTNAKLVYNGSTSSTLSNNQTGTACSSVLFRSATDFSLLAGSPAINTGTATITAAGFSATITNNLSITCPNGQCDIGALISPHFDTCTAQDAAPTVVEVLLKSSRTIQGSAAANWTRTGTATGNPSSVAFPAAFQINVTLSAAVVNGNTLNMAYTAPASAPLRDTINIGGTLSGAQTQNAAVRTFGAQACANNVGQAPSTAVLDQYRYRLALMDPRETPARYLATENTNITVGSPSVTYVRLKVRNTTADWGSATLRAYYRKNGGAATLIPDVAGADKIGYWPQAPLAGQSIVITEQLAAAATFIPGVFLSAGAGLSSTFTTNAAVEHVLALHIDQGATLGDTYEIRLRLDPAADITFTAAPTLTIGKVRGLFASGAPY